MNHHRTVLAAVLALVATVLLSGLSNTPTNAHAADRAAAADKRHTARWWFYELDQLLKYARNREHVSRSWDRKTRPSRREIIELDPPLPTTSPGKVEIEMLYTYLADLPNLRRKLKWTTGAHGFQGWPSHWTERAWRNWWFEKVPEEIQSRIRLKLSPVGAMPGGNPALNDYHVEYQKMVMAWDPTDDIGVNNPVHWDLRIRLADTGYIYRFDADTVRRATERALKRAGVPIEDWRRAAAAEDTLAKMRRNTERLAEITRRSRALDESFARPPRLAVILINGRYVIESSNVPKLRRRFQIANWLIDRELEKLD